MWQVIAKALLGKLPEELAEYYKDKQKLKQELALTRVKGEIALAEAKAIAEAKKYTHESNWEMKSLDHSGWKDEYWTIVLSSPLILIFIPFFQPYIAQGFIELENVPEWYLVSIGVAIAGAFGVRPIIDYFTRGRGGKKA